MSDAAHLDPHRERLRERVLSAASPDGDRADAMVLADHLLERGDPADDPLLGAALDRAFGLDPGDPFVEAERRQVLDRLARFEHGLRLRYVPAGTFLMGSASGDPDERPVHPVRLDGYWIGETPITWAAFCHLMGWTAPPEAMPPDDPDAAAARGGGFDRERFSLYNDNKIRLQYCETHTRRARDWHAHAPSMEVTRGGERVSPEELFGPVDRDPARPWRYDVKPMVAVPCAMAEALCRRLSSPAVTYRLPTEAEWEKAARGGLVGARYAWGDEPPDPARCDFDRFGDFSIRPPKSLPPNGYGLFGMCGGVAEWTADPYDALAYRGGDPTAPAERPLAARAGEAPPAPHARGASRGDSDAERVVRGGSWSDCAAAVTVSFRASLRPDRAASPTIGFRVVRIEHAPTR